MKFMQIRHIVVALAFAAIAPLAFADFRSDMTVEQAEAEARAQLAAKATLVQIAQRALAAKLSPGLVTTALLNATDVPVDEVITAVLRGGAPLQDVVNAALVAGISRDAIAQGAVNAGYTLAVALAAIASSPTQVAGGPNGGLGAGGGGGRCGPKSVSPC